MADDSRELDDDYTDVARDDDDDSTTSSSSSLYIHLILTYVAPSLFCLISVVGVIGNSFVIYVITTTPHMRSSATNILLLNLAVADLYFLVVCAPFMAYKYATLVAPVGWTFGDLACKLVGFSTYASSYVTVYTLVAISALRYLYTTAYIIQVRLSYTEKSKREQCCCL